MKLKPYTAYKDSGVEWLGEVPEHWDVKRLGYYFSERREKVSDKDYPPLSVTKNGVVPQLETAAKTDDGDNRKLVRAGDFVINSRSDRKGSSGLSELDGSVSLINTILQPYDLIHGRFCHHLMRSYPFQEEFYRYGKGIVADLWSTNYSEMRNISLSLPDPVEQTAIATFLDRETAKLDTLIAKQEKLIELLQEKRQAVISHAVTKGLDPDVPMKDSGVEWLGEVPAHWGRTTLKRIVSTPITDGPHETPEFLDDGVPFVSAEAVSSGRIDFSKVRGFISREVHERYSIKYKPQRNDIYMVKSGATTGVTAIVETDDEFNIWSPLAAIRCNESMCPRYVLSFLRSRNFQEAVALNWSFGTQQNIGMGVIENLAIPLPPLQEQELIAEFINGSSSTIDCLIEKAERSIELAKEHRTALISAAVTGKIDVRNYAPN